MVLLLWIGGSALVAYLGRDRSVGSLGFFAFSLVFSPVVGALSLLVAGRRGDTSTRVRFDNEVLLAIRSLQSTTSKQQQIIDDLASQLAQARKAATPVVAVIEESVTH